MIIDYVDGDDWVAIYVDGKLHYEGHSVPKFIWLDILRDAVWGVNSVSSWTSEFETGKGLPLFEDQMRYCLPE